MAIYIYNLSDGSLYSWCPKDTDPVANPAQLAANGLGAVSGLPPLSPTVSWIPATLTTSTHLPATTVSAPPVSGTLTFGGVNYTVTGTTL